MTGCGGDSPVGGCCEAIGGRVCVETTHWLVSERQQGDRGVCRDRLQIYGAAAGSVSGFVKSV